MNAHTFSQSRVYKTSTSYERQRFERLFPPDPVSFFTELAARDFKRGQPLRYPFEKIVGLSEFGQFTCIIYLMTWRDLTGSFLTKEEAELVAHHFPL